MMRFFDFTQYLKYTIFFLYILYLHAALYTKSACIIVHGTWSSGAKWYQKGGDFYEALYESNKKLQIVDEIVSFTWSGALAPEAHHQAGASLVKCIKQYDSVILVAHSFGVSVGIIASKLLGKSGTPRKYFHRIEKFYALGGPILEARLKPNMNIIHRLYNLFSYGDMIQTVTGTHQRTFSDYQNIKNIAISFNYHWPDHFDLHHVNVGNHLLYFDYYAQNNINNFESLSSNIPGKIIFQKDQLPYYHNDPQQKKEVALDEEIQKIHAMNCLRKYQKST